MNGEWCSDLRSTYVRGVLIVFPVVRSAKPIVKLCFTLVPIRYLNLPLNKTSKPEKPRGTPRNPEIMLTLEVV